MDILRELACRGGAEEGRESSKLAWDGGHCLQDIGIGWGKGWGK